MPRIPLPNGFEGSEQLPQTNQNLTNCFNNGQGKILSRPGILPLNTSSGLARGSFEWNDALYMVFSTSLIKITNTETGASTTIGTIVGFTAIETAVGFVDAVIVAKGGAIYTLSKTDVLTLISGNANFVPSVDVAHINGRFVYIPSDGSPAFFSDVGAAGTVQSTSFFDAETLPDKNNSVFNLNNTLYIGGTDSFELFRNPPGAPELTPFIRITGGAVRSGFIGGLVEAADTFFFIGRKKDHGAQIFAMSPGRGIALSNERIDLILSTYTNAELADAIPGRIIWRGYDIATFALGRDSFAFAGGNWFILDTLFNDVSSVWGGGFITEFEGEYFTAFEGRIGKFAKVNTDYGERVTKIIGMGVQFDDMDFQAIQSMELGLSQGFNSANGSIALRMSRNNVQFGPELYINTGTVGQYNNRIKWNPAGGLGIYEGFFGYEIFTTEDIDVAASFLNMVAR